MGRRSGGWRRWFALAVLGLLVLSLQSGVRHFSVAERVAAPYVYDLVGWEIANLPDKWVHLAASVVGGDGVSEVQRRRWLAGYWGLAEELGRSRYGVRYAAIEGDLERLGRLQAAYDAEGERLRAMVDDAEAVIEGAVADAVAQEGLGVFGGWALPPTDIRLSDPPKLMVVSPRDRIERRYDVLLRSDVTFAERAAMEDAVLRDADLSALVEDIGGIATYPASIPLGFSLRWTLQTTAHEWLHHYLFFRPLGQHLFDDADMMILNETVANIAGRELGDVAYVMLGYDLPDDGSLGVSAAAGGGDDGEDLGERFDFAVEMRRTREMVDALLAEGRVEAAEAYMEERRREFVANGYPIRKLNQAYFAFYGTYADLPASVSPIGGEVHRFRGLHAGVGEFVRSVSGVSSYAEFLDVLEAMEAEAGS